MFGVRTNQSALPADFVYTHTRRPKSTECLDRIKAPVSPSYVASSTNCEMFGEAGALTRPDEPDTLFAAQWVEINGPQIEELIYTLPLSSGSGSACWEISDVWLIISAVFWVKQPETKEYIDLKDLKHGRHASHCFTFLYCLFSEFNIYIQLGIFTIWRGYFYVSAQELAVLSLFSFFLPLLQHPRCLVNNNTCEWMLPHTCLLIHHHLSKASSAPSLILALSSLGSVPPPIP